MSGIEDWAGYDDEEHVGAILDDFNEKAFGYDMKMLLYSPCI